MMKFKVCWRERKMTVRIKNDMERYTKLFKKTFYKNN